MGVAVVGSRARVHLSRMVIVSSGGSCKILQVSNHCGPTSDVGMCRGQPVTVVLRTFSSLPVARVLTSVLLGGAKEDGVVGMGLERERELGLDLHWSPASTDGLP